MNRSEEGVGAQGGEAAGVLPKRLLTGLLERKLTATSNHEQQNKPTSVHKAGPFAGPQSLSEIEVTSVVPPDIEKKSN